MQHKVKSFLGSLVADRFDIADTLCQDLSACSSFKLNGKISSFLDRLASGQHAVICQ